MFCFLLTSFDLDHYINATFHSTAFFLQKLVCCLVFKFYLWECVYIFVCGCVCMFFSVVLYSDCLDRVSPCPWSSLIWFGCSLFAQDQNYGSKQLLSQHLSFTSLSPLPSPHLNVSSGAPIHVLGLSVVSLELLAFNTCSFGGEAKLHKNKIGAW